LALNYNREPLLNCAQLAKEHARAPFFVFQMMCCALWSFEDNFLYRFCLVLFQRYLFAASHLINAVRLCHSGMSFASFSQN
jgi:hypothetical protein